MQDISSRTSAKPRGIRPVEDAAPAGRERLRVLLLGANLWALCVLWPALANRAESRTGLVADALSALPLALGTAVFGRTAPALGGGAAPARWARPALLLVVFPTGLAASFALRPEAQNAQLYGPLGLVLLACSLCAYGAGVVSSLGTGAPRMAATHVALGADPWDAAPPERSTRQRAFIAVCFVGAAAVALIAPALGGSEALERAWGESAPLGGVLSAVVGTALGVSVLAVYMGHALRAPSAAEREPRTDTTLRTVWFLFLALLGALTYLIVQP